MDKKLLDMELKIRKTFNNTMEQHVEAVKAIEEEIVEFNSCKKNRGILWWHWSLVSKN